MGNVGYSGGLRYRWVRRVINRYQRVTLYFLKLRYRFIRRFTFRFHNLFIWFVTTRFRLLRRLRFRILRLLIFFIWRLWVAEVHGFQKIPMNEGAVIVSNHLSYFDFWILSAVLKHNTVFIAVKNLDKRGIVGWTMKLNTIVYVDRDKPGASFFKKIMWYLTDQARSVVIYPEGTRSRSGRMLVPKPGFVKLALKAGVSIIPVAMRGTYDVLPPEGHFPRFRKCDVYILDKTYISPSNPEFYDIFFGKKGDRRFEDLNDDELQEIAFRIMDRVRMHAGQEWEPEALLERRAVAKRVMENKQMILS